MQEQFQDFLNAMDGVTYLVDGTGTILAVGQPQWLNFLEKTEFIPSRTEDIIGANLFDLVTGEEVRESYRRMHQKVYEGHKPSISFQYRCDGPEVKRQMRLSLSWVSLGEGEGGVLYQSQIISEVERPPIGLLDPELILGHLAEEQNYPIVTICSYCQQVAWPIGETANERREWLSPEDYYARGGHSDVRISHGICPGCVARLEAA